MNQNKVRDDAKANTMQLIELKGAKERIKKLEDEVRALKGKPAEQPKTAPAPKTKDVVLASNKALREALALLKRVNEQVEVETYEGGSVVRIRNNAGNAAKDLVEDLQAFLALDLDSTVSASPKPAVVVTRAQPVVVMRPDMRFAAAPKAPGDAPPVVK